MPTDGRLRWDRIQDLQQLLKEIRTAGGEPDFILYAWTASLLADEPSQEREKINRILRERINSKILSQVKSKARALIRDLAAVGPAVQGNRAITAADQALTGLIRWIGHDLLLKSPRGRHVVRAWRYEFFGAVWPYFEFRKMKSLSWRWSWLQEWFDAGDGVVLLDRSFGRKGLQRGGIELSALRLPAFRIVPRKDRGNADTARAWWETARATKDFSLHTALVASVDAYLEWRHKLYRPQRKEQRVLPPHAILAEDRRYALAAWKFLQKELTYTELPGPPPDLVPQCLPR